MGKDEALSLEPLVPNDETIKAMKAARRGDLVTVESITKLFESLNADGLPRVPS